MLAVPSPTTNLDVVIVGGGIAGLVAAYCLGRSGHRITIVEQEPWLEEIGAGIQLAPSTSPSCLGIGSLTIKAFPGVQMHLGFSCVGD